MRGTQRFRVLALTVFLLSTTNNFAQDWPQWRGPNRDAKVTGFMAPKVWPKELTMKWTATVGTGVSSLDLVGDKLYAFGRIDGDEVTTCLDAATGKVMWQEKYATAAVGGAARDYGGPRSTPAVADGKIYTLGVNGTVSCVDIKSGKEVWRKDTKEKPGFATSVSPLVAEGLCVVFLNALTAFDAATGDIKWTGPQGTPYGSPVLMTVAGVKQVVSPTADALIGVNLTDGKELWQAKLPKGNYMVSYGTPIVDGQIVIYGVAGKAGTTLAFKIERKDAGFTATEVWKGSGSYQYNTPVLHNGLLFGLSPDKKFFCMEAKDGKILWTDETQRGEAGGVLGAGSVILALTGPANAPKGKGSETSKGEAEFVAFEPSKTGYKELAKYKLSTATGLAYPIIAGKRVYIKGNNDITLWTID